MKIEGDDKKVAEVATISAGDAEIGKLIAEVISKIGKDGVVTVEAGQGLEMEQEIVEGFSYDKGYSSPFKINPFSGSILKLLQPKRLQTLSRTLSPSTISTSQQ